MDSQVEKSFTIKTESRKFYFFSSFVSSPYDPKLTTIRCRACNTLLDFQFATKGAALPSSHSKSIAEFHLKAEDKKEGPPDVEKLGRSSWTLLHSIAANYPEHPSNKEQSDLKQFLKLFGNFYPCWYCGEDFSRYMEKAVPQTESQSTFGKWLCEAHNEVNEKLGKPKFDCNLWKKRWRDGWDDKE